MKKMWSDDELIKFLEEHGGKITPEELLKALQEGENITLEIVEAKEGTKLRISASGGEITPQILFDLIKGSESVIVDLSEDEEYLEIHLDADILAKIDRALLLPLSVSEFKLIGVDNETNKKTRKNAPTQQLLGLDSNTLEIVNGVLKVKGGSVPLYEYTININSGTNTITIQFISKDNKDSFTYSEIREHIGTLKALMTSGHWEVDGTTYYPNILVSVGLYLAINAGESGQKTLPEDSEILLMRKFKIN